MHLFALGDTHLSFSTDKPMDIFRGWENHESRLQSSWNAVVAPEDCVVIPGDISWAMGLADAKADFAFLHALNGQKLILKGNHDYWWNTMKKMDAFLSENEFTDIRILHNNAYRVGDYCIAGSRGWFFDDAGEDDKKVILREAGRLRTSIAAAKALGGELLVFLHYPPLSSMQRCEEIMEVLRESGTKRVYFGHLHGYVPTENAAFEADGIRFTLVSADHLAFCPLRIG